MVVESRFHVDTIRTCRLLVTATLCTCDILRQQVFSVITRELVSFDIRTG